MKYIFHQVEIIHAYGCIFENYNSLLISSIGKVKIFKSGKKHSFNSLSGWIRPFFLSSQIVLKHRFCTFTGFWVWRKKYLSTLRETVRKV